MKQTLTLEEIYVPIEGRLAQIPDVIFQILASPNELTHEVIRHFFSRPGKFLRIALTFFGATIEKPALPSAAEEEKLLRLGAAFEIFHSATLIHDDIIDSAFIRRNIPTVHIKWNPQVAVLVGDYLHDKAIEAIFGVGNSRITAAFLKTAGTVCDGEIHELAEKNNFNLKEAEYLRIIDQKTASLIACAVESGGILAGLSPEQSEGLRRFGRSFGMAFQIIDDCLDFTGEEHEFGKTLGADCEAGVLTLPLIRLIELVDEPAKSEVFKIFKSGFGSGRFETLKGLLMEYGTIDYAVSKAQELTELARLELSVFGASPARTSLERLLEYVLERNR